MSRDLDALPEGTKLAGYEIRRVLGRGGFGITYFATDALYPELKFAIKEFLPAGLATRESGKRAVRPLSPTHAESFRSALSSFEREARTLVALRHPNLVEAQRYIEENGTAYLVMKFEEGAALSELLGAKKILGEATIMDFLPPLLDGLEAVHAKKFVHRDIKPANIYLRAADGSPVLLDFGAARQAIGSERQKSLSEILTHGYAPLEQYDRYAAQGAYTDIYALGATLYRCMTGLTPADAITRHNALRRGEPDALDPIEKAAAGRYSASLLAAVRASLMVDERERPQTVAVLRTILGLKPGGASRGEPTPILMGGAGGTPPPREVPRPGGDGRASRRPASIERGLRSLRLALTMILIGVALIAAVLVDGMRTETGFLKIGDEMVPIARGLAALLGILLALTGFPALFALLGGRVLVLWLAIGATIIGLLEVIYLGATIPNIRRAADLAETPVEFCLSTIGLVSIGLAAIPLWSRNVRALRRAAAAMDPPLRRAVFTGRWFRQWAVVFLVVVTVGAAALAVARPWDAAPSPRVAAAARPGSDTAACRDGAGWRARCVFRDCPGCPEMVVIPGGTFTMGSPPDEKDRSRNEGPPHPVTVQQFALGKYDVTRGEFAAFVRDTGYRATTRCFAFKFNAATKKFVEDSSLDWSQPGFAQTDQHPVVCVNWHGAKAYAAWLSRKTGKTYRLPSEAEWEYATRASNKTTRMYWGDDPDFREACRYANSADQQARQAWNASGATAPCDDGYDYTAPVGSYEANRFGLFDMSGNVRKWIEDCWHDTYAGAPSDGKPWITPDGCALQVLRGGSWISEPSDLRSAHRVGYAPAYRTSFFGFRVARGF